MEVVFDGQLVYLSGSTAGLLDGQTGETRQALEVDGELGWSGFTQLAPDGSIVYESLTQGTPAIRRAMPDVSSTTLVDGLSAVHGSSEGFVLVSNARDTFMIDLSTDDMSARALGIGTSLSAQPSSDGSELAYVQAVTTEEPEQEAGELEQRLMLERVHEPDDGTEIARGWHGIDPLFVGERAILYATHPFGGVETVDVVLFDRGSQESTTLVNDVRILDSDPETGSIAIAASVVDDDETATISIIGIEDPSQVSIAHFENADIEAVTSARLMPDGTGLVCAFAYEDGTATLEVFETASGTHRTVMEDPDAHITELIVHPSGRHAVLVLEEDGVGPTVSSRAIVACDLREHIVQRVVTGSPDRMLHLIGFLNRR